MQALLYQTVQKCRKGGKGGPRRENRRKCHLSQRPAWNRSTMCNMSLSLDFRISDTCIFSVVCKCSKCIFMKCIFHRKHRCAMLSSHIGEHHFRHRRMAPCAAAAAAVGPSAAQGCTYRSHRRPRSTCPPQRPSVCRRARQATCALASLVGIHRYFISHLRGRAEALPCEID